MSDRAKRLRAAVLASDARLFREEHGRWHVRGDPTEGALVVAASKAGLVGFAKAVALEVASRNITVNVVAPGMIETDMTHAIADKAREALVERIPLGRLGAPDEVAAAVAFLASDEAAYITGQVLAVNGGMYL